MMITVHVSAARIPPDHAGGLMAAAAERLVAVSPELADVIAAIICRIRPRRRPAGPRLRPPRMRMGRARSAAVPARPRQHPAGYHRLERPEAVYPEQAIQAHLAFLARRRAQRPTDEYRVPTDVIWGFQDQI
jgi:hypothetical protein